MLVLHAFYMVAALAAVAKAQDAASGSPSFATRGMLESQAVAAESVMATARSAAQREWKRAEAWVLRHRLQAGDFRPGDRIALSIDGHPTMSDTLIVRAGPTLLVPDLPKISLAGVLRAELHDHLVTEIGKSVRNPRIQAVPLMRVAVLGQVGRPGFYGVPADALLSDAIMIAGGPSPDADLGRVTIRRDAENVIPEATVAVALRGGVTLDQLNLGAGAEILVGQRRRPFYQSVFGAATAVSSLIAMLYFLRRS